MYARHFNLHRDAFALTPDPAFLYPSPSHVEALAALKVGLLGRRGLMVMTGEVGTGKTTLLYSLLRDLSPSIHTAYIANSRLGFDGMLRQALADFGVACDGGDRFALLHTLNSFLTACARQGTTAALVIDEAQNLDDATFEEIRLLSNFETFSTKLLQIVLVGQPELEARLRRRCIRQIAERVAVRCRIAPLSRAESRRYLEHRLECAGGSLAIFSKAALQCLLWAAAGLPRRLNILAHNALLFAYGRGETQVSLGSMTAAVREQRHLTGGGAHLGAMLETARTRLATWRASALRPALLAAGVVAALGVTAGLRAVPNRGATLLDLEPAFASSRSADAPLVTITSTAAPVRLEPETRYDADGSRASQRAANPNRSSTALREHSSRAQEGRQS